MSKQTDFSLLRTATGETLAEIRVASGFVSRMRGLYGSKAPAPGEGLLLVPCSAVQGFFMPYGIDVVMLDKAGTVLAVKTLSPWQIQNGPPGTFAILETAQGSGCRFRPGETLKLRARDAGIPQALKGWA